MIDQWNTVMLTGGSSKMPMVHRMIESVMGKPPRQYRTPELLVTIGAAYWAHAAPYGELDMGDYSTSAYIRSLVPGAFSILNMSDGDLVKHRATVVEAVRRGDVLMMHGWWSPKRNAEVREIYEEVYPGFMEKGDQAAIVRQ